MESLRLWCGQKSVFFIRNGQIVAVAMLATLVLTIGMFFVADLKAEADLWKDSFMSTFSRPPAATKSVQPTNTSEEIVVEKPAQTTDEPTYEIGEAARPEPVRITYDAISMQAPPFPVGAHVEQVDTVGRAFLWEDWTDGVGFVSRTIELPRGVDVFVDWMSGNYSSQMPGAVGDKFIITGYSDWKNPVDNFTSDGLVDSVNLREALELGEDDLVLIKMRDEFVRALVDKNLVVISTAGRDYPPAQILLDGKPARLGPWGMTYYARPSGSIYGEIEQDGERDANVVLRPGQFFNSLEGAPEDLADAHPYVFRRLLGWNMIPQWQPEGLVPMSLQKSFGLYDAHDSSWPAVMARYGFENATGYHGADFPDWNVWLGVGADRQGLPEMTPKFTWRTVPGNELQLGNGKALWVGLAYDGKRPYPRFDLWQDGHSEDEPDISKPFVGFDMPFFLEPKGNNVITFSPVASGAHLCRGVRSAWREAVMQCAEWAPAPE